jgi:membrane protein YqaA with SNARE-associated domain
MLDAVLLVCAAFALAFVINLVPAFMPSTWMVMAFFYIKFDLPLLVLTIGSAIASALGRLVLAHLSLRFRQRFIKGKNADDLTELGNLLNRRGSYVGPTVFVYSLSPLPTNNLFIAAGLAGMNMTVVVVAFTLARMIANTFWVWTTNRAFDSLSSVFKDALTGPLGIALEVIGLISIVVLFKLPWARWLRRLLRDSPAGTS